jgi:hypothetical protein
MKTVHDVVLVGIGADSGDFLVRQDRNVQAGLVDDPGLQEGDKGPPLVRFVVAGGGG